MPDKSLTVQAVGQPPVTSPYPDPALVLEAELPAGNELIGSVTLAAGSATIGKVGIDQTTPGTTNKVSLGSDTVATRVTQASTTFTSTTKATAAGHTIIAAPAQGYQLAIRKLQVQAEADGDNTVTVNTSLWRTLLTTKGSGTVLDFPQDAPLLLPAATALTVTLSAALSVGISVQYETRAV